MNKKERFQKAFEYLKKYGVITSQSDIAAIMETYSQNISRAYNGDDRYLTDKFLSRFNTAFSNIFNLDWLLTGEGEMLSPTANPTGIVNSQNTVQNNSTMSIGNKELEKELIEMIKRKDEQIKEQSQQISRKDEQIDRKDEQINALLKMLGERK